LRETASLFLEVFFDVQVFSAVSARATVALEKPIQNVARDRAGRATAPARMCAVKLGI
jgi:hypothetical protein